MVDPEKETLLGNIWQVAAISLLHPGKLVSVMEPFSLEKMV
jgi:hypothetical protein